jgi:hypothetical protein
MRYVCCYPESKQPTSYNKLQNGWVEAINRQFGWAPEAPAKILQRSNWPVITGTKAKAARQLVKLPVNALTTQISEFLKSRSF